MFTYRKLVLSLFLASLAFVSLPFSGPAQAGWGAEEVVIYIKRIRDEQNNYLRDVTLATARAVSESGEFKALPHKRNAKGPVIEVSPPTFNYAQYQGGMNAREMTTAGLSVVSDVSNLFGFGNRTRRLNEVNARLNRNSAILDAWGDNDQVMVTMQSRVLLFDQVAGVEIARAIDYEKVFNSKSEFLAQKDSLIQEAVVSEVKKVLVEYLEDSGF
ncbi:hypothetical protein [Alkalimonas sp.]|uniref:hypothetical protein n=1 Tax=Alkalimonas sp. TaxID=1872453 RepID=UPI00263BA453|nr:hypothetical protein [Alkalimonas sp.]MCC5826676.1 hypothetical protein [Alkalimonas sp.]